MTHTVLPHAVPVPPIPPTPTPPPDRLLRLSDVLAILPVKKSTWWAWVKQGKAPAPVRLGRCTCWKQSAVMAMAGLAASHE